MKRVFILIVLLISTYVFEIVFLYPGNIADEAYYYRDTTQVSVTNTTIYKDDLQHYYKSIKTLEKTNFENFLNSSTISKTEYLLFISEFRLNVLETLFVKLSSPINKYP